MAMAEAKPAHVYTAMNAVMEAIGKEGISKDRTGPATQGAYKFRGIDDVYNALNPLMAEHKLLLVPVKVAPTYETFPGRNNNVVTYCRAVVTFNLISALDGSSHMAETLGEGMDSSDKASNKAMSAAMKYASLMVFMIPTEAESVDSERDDLTPAYHDMARGASQTLQDGRGRDSATRGQGDYRRPPGDDFPGDRDPNGGRPPPRDDRGAQDERGSGGSARKTSAQAKKDGDWEMLERLFALQRTEEELVACGKANEHVLGRMPPKWRDPAKDLFAHHLKRVRRADREAAERRTDSSFDPRTGEVLDDPIPFGDDEDPNVPESVRQARQASMAGRG